MVSEHARGSRLRQTHCVQVCLRVLTPGCALLLHKPCLYKATQDEGILISAFGALLDDGAKSRLQKIAGELHGGEKVRVSLRVGARNAALSRHTPTHASPRAVPPLHRAAHLCTKPNLTDARH